MCTCQYFAVGGGKRTWTTSRLIRLMALFELKWHWLQLAHANYIPHNPHMDTRQVGKQKAPQVLFFRLVCQWWRQSLPCFGQSRVEQGFRVCTKTGKLRMIKQALIDNCLNLWVNSTRVLIQMCNSTHVLMHIWNDTHILLNWYCGWWDFGT